MVFLALDFSATIMWKMQ